MDSGALISGLMSADKEEVNEALIYIAREKPDDLIEVMVDVLLSNEEAWKKSNIIKALKHYQYDKTIDVSLDVLEKSPSFIVKREIIDYLAKSHSKKIVIPIAKELDSPFHAVRESAILALKEVGDDRMYPSILNMLESENPVFRVYALEALYYLYDIRFYGLLIKSLKDENKSIRHYVLRCIENNRIKDALPHVRRTALNDESWEIRVKAINILGILNDDNSLYVLVKCLPDENREVRFSSAKALKILKFRASAHTLSEQLAVEGDDVIKRIIIDTHILINNAGGYKGLRRILKEDGNVDLRILSAFALGTIRYRESIDVLLSALDDPDEKVRAEICNSLGYYKTREVVQSLLEIINDDPERYVRTAALYSIMRIDFRYTVVPLFDRYVIEDDPVMKEKLRFAVRKFIQ